MMWGGNYWFSSFYEPLFVWYHISHPHVGPKSASPRPSQCETGCARPVLLIFMWRKGEREQSKWSEGGNWFSSFLPCVCVCRCQNFYRALGPKPAPSQCERGGGISLFSCLWWVLTAVLQQDSIMLECPFFSLWASAGSEIIIKDNEGTIVFSFPDSQTPYLAWKEAPAKFIIPKCTNQFFRWC